jgi:putative oxidoreductase
MNTSLQSPVALAGRILLAAMFLIAGLGKIADFASTVGYMQSQGVPAAPMLAVLAILAEVGGGIALIAGFQTRFAALGLAVFTLVASLIFHPFWSLPAAQQMVPQLLFMKNVSVIGGLLVVAAFGAGRWSLDAVRGQSRGAGTGVASGQPQRA